MKRKLIAVAVAGAFAAPGIASAQVTISGKLGIVLNNIKISDELPARAGLHKSQTYMNDNASIIRIGARESLGGGLEAFGQYEFRPLMDGNSTGPAGTVQSGSATPVSYVGLKSNAWGSIRAGTDITWSQTGSGLGTSAAQHYSTSPILSYFHIGGTNTSFSSSRQRNVIIYDTPDFKNGFRATAIWSASPTTDEKDLATGNRKGRAWYFLPEYRASNWKAGYTYMDQKQEVAGAGTASTPWDLKGHKIYGDIKLGFGLEIGLTYAKLKADHGVTGVQLADVKKWLLPVRYRAGNNTFGAFYGVSSDDKIQAGDQKYQLTGVSYNYNFSRRTNMGVSWIRMKNQGGANADITSTTSASYGTINSSAGLGEDQNMLALSLNHNF